MTTDEQVDLLVECFGNGAILFEEDGRKIGFNVSVTGWWIKHEHNGNTYICAVLKFVNEYLEKHYPINGLKYKNFMRLKKLSHSCFND